MSAKKGLKTIVNISRVSQIPNMSHVTLNNIFYLIHSVSFFIHWIPIVRIIFGSLKRVRLLLQ